MVTEIQLAPPKARHPERSKPRLSRPAQSKDPNAPRPAPALRTFLPQPAREQIPSPASGFTLLELIIVMVIIGILAAIAIPAFKTNVIAAREAVLREDLQVMRTAIQSYTVDKQKAPQSLEDIVTGGYIKALPKDPITGRTDTWVTTQSDTLSTIDQTDSGGIDDVHSGAQLTALDGTAYNTW